VIWGGLSFGGYNSNPYMMSVPGFGDAARAGFHDPSYWPLGPSEDPVGYDRYTALRIPTPVGTPTPPVPPPYQGSMGEGVVTRSGGYFAFTNRYLPGGLTQQELLRINPGNGIVAMNTTVVATGQQPGEMRAIALSPWGNDYVTIAGYRTYSDACGAGNHEVVVVETYQADGTLVAARNLCAGTIEMVPDPNCFSDPMCDPWDPANMIPWYTVHKPQNVAVDSNTGEVWLTGTKSDGIDGFVWKLANFGLTTEYFLTVPEFTGTSAIKLFDDPMAPTAKFLLVHAVESSMWGSWPVAIAFERDSGLQIGTYSAPGLFATDWELMTNGMSAMNGDTPGFNGNGYKGCAMWEDF
jgi:hypothetical protein